MSVDIIINRRSSGIQRLKNLQNSARSCRLSEVIFEDDNQVLSLPTTASPINPINNRGSYKLGKYSIDELDTMSEIVNSSISSSPYQDTDCQLNPPLNLETLWSQSSDGGNFSGHFFQFDRVLHPESVNRSDRKLHISFLSVAATRHWQYYLNALAESGDQLFHKNDYFSILQGGN